MGIVLRRTLSMSVNFGKLKCQQISIGFKVKYRAE